MPSKDDAFKVAPRIWPTLSHDEKPPYGRTTLRLDIPNKVMAAMREVVESRRIPEIRSTSDIGRSALYNGAVWISTWVNDPAFVRIPTIMDEMWRLDELIERQNDHRKLVNGCESVLRNAIGSQERNEALTRCKEAAAVADDLHVKTEILELVRKYE